MSDLIKREDAIKAVEECLKLLARPRYTVKTAIEAIPSVDIPHSDDWKKYSDKLWRSAYERGKADRPQGEVDAVEIYERAEHNLEQGYITIGEFDERIEPLRHLCYGRPQGEWIVSSKDSICPICGKDEAEFICGTEDWYGYGLSNYCPNCGARMKGADDE